MDINTFTAGLTNPAVFLPQLLEANKPLYQTEAYQNYEPDTHRIVIDKHYRPDNVYLKPIPGATKDPVTGEYPTSASIEQVARIALSIQKNIVKYAVRFATGGTTVLAGKGDTAPQKLLLQKVQDIWDANKLRYKNGPLMTAVLSQLEAAEIWYTERDTDISGRVTGVKLRNRFYFPAEGWQLIPVFDIMGDLLAFGIKYIDITQDQKPQVLKMYTATELVTYQQTSGSEWAEIDRVKHGFRKIPVVYYAVDKSAWHDVQLLIDRLEKLMSVMADVNDYNGTPILGLYGEDISLPQKGKAGKVLQFRGGADAKYITWDAKPEAIISEHDMLMRFINSLTQTPDLSFEALQALGDVSGVAFDRILIGSHMKAKDAQEGWWGEGIQRRLNIIKSAVQVLNPALASVDLEIEPQFGLFKLDDEAERIDNMLKANGGKVLIGHRESVQQAGLVQEVDAAMAEIKADADEAQARVTQQTDKTNLNQNG